MNEAMKAKMEERDKGWGEVMSLAKKYGFILQAAGGTATLATNKSQLEAWGEEGFLKHQRNFFGGFDRPE